ncbi:MAG TPA: tail fiber domain-containing protein [Polyangiaceae bacterium]|nr:tail fiber domain-containing protein [Polyangiaceae bacterium]
MLSTKTPIMLSAIAITTALALSLDAKANITCGEYDACNNNTASFEVYNGSTNTSDAAIYGAAGYGIGVKGTGTWGVYGLADGSSSDIGVYGVANDGTGVYGSGVTGVGGLSTTNGGVGVYGLYYNSTAVGYGVYGQSGPAGYAGYFAGNVAYTGSLTHVSDIRLKKNIKPLDGAAAIDLALKLHGVTFEWKDPGEHSGPGTQWGFIAQDVEKVFPNWVKTDANGIKMIDTTGVEPLLLESVRTLKASNDKLHARVSTLEERLTKLEDAQAGHRPLASGFGGGASLGLIGLAAMVSGLALGRRRR